MLKSWRLLHRARVEGSYAFHGTSTRVAREAVLYGFASIDPRPMSDDDDRGAWVVRGTIMRCAAIAVLVALGGCRPTEPDEIADSRAVIARAEKVLDETSVAIEAAKPVPDWALIEDKSPITDAPSVQIVTLSQTLDGVYGIKRVGLRVRCDEGQLRAQLEWPEVVGDAATWPVTLRFDAAPAENMVARVTVDRMDTGWAGDEAAKMIRRLASSQKLAARILTEDGEQMTPEFITVGLVEYLPKLEAACPRLASSG